MYNQTYTPIVYLFEAFLMTSYQQVIHIFKPRSLFRNLFLFKYLSYTRVAFCGVIHIFLPLYYYLDI